MMTKFWAIFTQSARLSWRASGGAVLGVVFFLAVIILMPFAIGPNLKLLAQIGPALLWVGALLATLFGLDRLFQADAEDGTLDLLMLSPLSLELIVLARGLGHWAATSLPLILSTPLLALMLNLDRTTIGAVTLTLLVGTPALVFIGVIGASLIVTLQRGGMLLAILVLPLTIPVLIFGVSAASALNKANAIVLTPFLSSFLMLCALTLIAMVIGTIASAAALRAAQN